jgi:hypothetical protein
MTVKKINYLHMKLQVYCLLFFYTSICSAQDILPVQQDTTRLKTEFVVAGNAFFQSNSVTSEFGGRFIYGGMITDEMKDASMSGMTTRSRNRFGAVSSNSIVYRNYSISLFGFSNLGLVVQAGHEFFTGTQFTKDAFSFVFKGNAHVDNDYADFTDTRFHSISYQKIGVGVVDKISRSSVAINFVNGQQYKQMDIRNGAYYQNEDSDSIRLFLKGDYRQNKNNNFSNGIGFSIDAEFRSEINWMRDKKAWIQLKAQNIGVIFFDKAHYQVDTMYRYSGFNANTLFNSSNFINDDFQLIDSLGLSATQGKEGVWLPGLLQLAKIVDRTNTAKFQSFFGLNIYTNITYLPQLFAGIHYQPIKTLAIGGQLSYGGFGELRGGLYLDMKIKGFYLGVGTQDVYGTIAANGNGQSIMGRLTWQFE